MLSVDDFKSDAQTFQEMITEQTQVIAEANAALFRMEGAFNYIMRCIESLENQEVKEEDGLSETL